MNTPATHDVLSSATMEAVLGTGDITSLTSKQRVEYMTGACRALGLNPLTRPFRFLSLGGQTQLYATKDCADQLRRIHKINLHVVDKSVDGDLFTVTVRARTPDGREDEDMGAVYMGQSRGDGRANQIMRAITKAKRRVTMSICGLGFLDETEVESIPGAYTFDAEADPPATMHGRPVPPIARDEPISYSPRRIDTQAAANPLPTTAARQDPIDPLDEPNGTKWLENLRKELDNCKSKQEAEAIGEHPSVKKALAKAPTLIVADINDMLADALGRFVADGVDDAGPDFGEQEANESEER